MKKFLPALLVSLLCVSHPSHAELQVYEGFDYNTGQLRDKVGGEGWSGGWKEAHQGVEGGISLESAVGETPAVSGGHMKTPNGDWPAIRNLETPFAAAPGTYWISFLAANLGNTREETYANLSFQPEEGDGKTAVGFAKDFNAANWALKAGGVTRATQTPATDSPVFVVIRLTIAEGKEASDAAIFLDPDLSTEPVTPDAEIVGVNLDPIEKVMIRCGTGEKLFGFDEIRLGTSYASVAPKP